MLTGPTKLVRIAQLQRPSPTACYLALRMLHSAGWSWRARTLDHHATQHPEPCSWPWQAADDAYIAAWVASAEEAREEALNSRC